MPRGKFFGVLILIALLGVGGIVIRAELTGHPAASDATTGPAPTKDQSAQRQAEQKSEQQAIDSACAALQKMGGVNKNCPPPAK